jgi:outer membrane lipoprotein-sorting protein
VIKKHSIVLIFLFILVFCAVSPVFAQEVVSATAFLEKLQGMYGGLTAFEADVEILVSGEAMSGHLSYMPPNLLRIDFSVPSTQVICSNGEDLVVYVPRYGYVLTQELKYMGGAENFGLKLLSSRYAVSYLNSPNMEALDAANGKSEMVTKLKFIAKGRESFSEIQVAVNKSGYIVQIKAINAYGGAITMDLSGVRLNSAIGKNRFNYDPPATANVQQNFLYDPE